MTQGARKLGIIAGAGEIPLRIVRACQRASRPYHVIAVDEFAEPIGNATPHTRVPISKIGAAITALKRNACKDVVFAGKLQRPDGGRVKLRRDWGGIVFLATNWGVLRGHDDGIHRAIANMLARHGLRVVSPLEAAPELAAKPGCLTRTEPSEKLKASFPAALRLAKQHGATKRGQAVVVRDGAILASEGRAGTDAMLAALGAAGGSGAVLAKAMAPNQLPTIDPPAIGESTIRHAAAAGLAGVVVEAGRSVIVDEARVRASADDAGLFLYASAAEAS